MRKMLIVALAAAVVLALFALPVAQASKPCTVPASWGPLRSAFNPWGDDKIMFYAFEAEDGTIRVLNRNKCEPQTDLEVGRTH